MENRVTLAYIAKQAGVSKQTVSRVINKRADVSFETRKRVQEIIDDLGYKPNALAQGLSAKQSFTIGVISSRLQYHGPQSMFTAIDSQAHLTGYRVIPYLLHEENYLNIDNHLRTIMAFRPDGIIWDIAKKIKPEPTINESQLLSSVPIVTTDSKLKGIHKVLDIQNVKASAVAVQHLIDQGYKNIGIITGLADWTATEQRLEGWRQALQDNGLAAQDEQIFWGDWTAESGVKGITQLLERNPNLDAVFACNDQMALGVLSELNSRKIVIPEDFGVVGYDDIAESAYFTPSLTTVRQPFDLYGKKLIAILIQMIEENVFSRSYTVPKPVAITPELIIRRSSQRTGSQ